jgi:hypothetical protein
MALYAFDGTWNTAKRDDEAAYSNTNVVRFFEAYDRRTTVKNFYVAGVGTRFDLIGRVLGGAFGLGVLARLNEAYDHLCRQWADGDRIIDIVGFSRGAATTLDFCHLIQKRQIRKPGTDIVIEPHPEIRFLGAWDIVAAFGLANLGLTGLNIGHHLYLPKERLRYAFHALALDERRTSFLPTRLNGACEVWFRGVHSDIGGGNGNRGLNDVALQWMMRKAMAAGLPIAEEDIAALKPDPTSAPNPVAELKVDIRLIGDLDRRHHTIAACEGYRTPPDTCPIETMAEEMTATEVGRNGLTILPEVFADRATVLASVAEAQARALGFALGDVREPLLSLIETRIPLVTDDQKLIAARTALIQLVTEMVAGAKRRGFYVLNEFFLNEALFKLYPLPPFTDSGS